MGQLSQKTSSRHTSLTDLIDVAILDGLPKDKSVLDDTPVFRTLEKNSTILYRRLMKLWHA